MNTQTKTFDETTPLAEILKALPENELDELDALGDGHDDTRWRIGEIARAWIDERHLPAMQIYKIIGKRTDYSDVRVKQFCYTARFYGERKELKERYHMLRYSIFEYARQCADVEAVLEQAMADNASLALVKITSPTAFDEIKDLWAKIPKRFKPTADSLLREFIARLQRLVEGRE